ncbi:hypothetical protein GCM10008014_00460 [Paenibacillus silvae]|uniref:HD-GYP domain-containing protein n=1 Tax=Paenibacillus silvae TaxID=1325358 RepID=A0ABQ1YW74_9BACL|nr:HD-GYP domain-containing protein [Paenibacillus silvae]GGH41127.1 hypothetical protein GCM10008014_00460 [Paenibacillus silvae]
MILKNVLDMLDPEHAKRVSLLSMDLARSLNLSEQDVERIGYGAHYHDIGKISIPASILESGIQLTEHEFEIMKRHVEYGLSILSVQTSEEMDAAKVIVGTHHERWDGTGYPNRLKGEEIPLYGRIVSICDTYDALTSKRSYKSAWPIDEALAYINNQKGKAFDPYLTEVFLQMIQEGALV